MIFVTVGTQLPFDRLIKQVDDIAVDYNLPFFAQIGPGKYQPKNMSFVKFCTASEVEEHIKCSTLVVAHAGMGTIISALVNGKPLVIVPRYFDFQEHRNDHQLATARKFQEKAGVFPVFAGDDLRRSINIALGFLGNNLISPYAPDDFISGLKNIIDA